MIRQISILTYLSIFTIFSSCKQETPNSKLNYNQKANEVIQQLIIDEPCDCILEIPKETLIKLSLDDNPRYDIRKKTIENLHLKNRAELDSLENVSINFSLDTSFLRKKNIEVIERKYLIDKKNHDSILKKCPLGLTSVIKPIFNKNYTIAVIYSKSVFTCIGTYPEVYIYDNGKWSRKIKTAGNSSFKP